MAARPPRRYAEGTTVDARKSQGEIAGILAQHGVTRQGWMQGPEGDELHFELQGHLFRFQIVRPTMDEIRRLYPNAYDPQAKLDAEWRRRWRANVLLPYMLTAGGQTVGELVVAGGLALLEGGR